MASRTVSPGGALLRASRMFSLPPPLPRPHIESDSGTIPYPVYQSITTPYASLQRGDWGFKRALPLRSTTKTSTPVVRVEAVDTLEHITEFRSSADHALTLLKWEEMGLPLTVEPTQRAGYPRARVNPFEDNVTRKSVFEDDSDITDMDNISASNDKRWRFRGPWLAGQNEGEFAEYLNKTIRSKKVEFREYLRGQCAVSLNREARMKATGTEAEAVSLKAEDVSEEQLKEYTRYLRKDVKSLYVQIRNFLDLAPVEAVDDAFVAAEITDFLNTRDGMNKEFTSGLKNLPPTQSPYGSGGPPKTHPSAGLSYSRTLARTFNHPEFGPQENLPPVEARIIMPKVRRTAEPVLGVGGFAASVPSGDTTFRSNPKSFGREETVIKELITFDPKLFGGNKTWVHPKHASVDADGKVVISVAHGRESAVAVRKGTTESMPKRGENAGGFKAAGFERPSTAAGRAADYGLGSGYASGGRPQGRSDPGSSLASLD